MAAETPPRGVGRVGLDPGDTSRRRECRGDAEGERSGRPRRSLAKRAKITREYVNKLEAGRYDPTMGTLQALAKALGVPAGGMR